MNNNNNKTHQCSECKKNFPKPDVYRIGIKKKEFFCRACANNIKSECMWCGKELKQKKWQGSSNGIKSERGKLAETIDRDNLKGERHNKYYLICEEGREWGIRPNGSCASRYNDWWVKKGDERRQKRQNQGWEKCQGKAIYHKDPKTGKEMFNWDCWNLVSPGKKYCDDDACIYYTAVYKNDNSAAREKIRQKWNQRDQEKYQKANQWWNSLSLVEKQAELKKEEEHLKNLGLQRQRCWIERLDKNSILFENDKLYYDNMDKIPPSFLDRFGLPGFQWESVWKNDGNSANALHRMERDKEISSKEISLQQAKENDESELVTQLEKQLQELKNQQQGNSTSENPTKNKVVVYSVIGLSLVVSIGFVIMLLKSKQKKHIKIIK